MKNLKYILTSFALFVIMISCNKDAVMNTIDSSDIGSVDATFQSTVLVTDLTEADNGTLKVLIHRGNAESAATVPIEATGEGLSLFTLASNSVQFAAGEYTKEISFNYNLAEVEPVTKYTFEVAIADKSMVSNSDISSIRVEAVLLLDYVLMGTGTFSSEFFEDVWDQPVYVATVTPTFKLYRLPGCYTEGFNLEFMVKDGEMLIEEQDTGYLYSDEHGNVSLNPVTTEISGNTCTVNATFHLRKSGSWFGPVTSAESITLP